MHARTCLPEYREHKELFKVDVGGDGYVWVQSPLGR